jgi:hypothetical protein
MICTSRRGTAEVDESWDRNQEHRSNFDICASEVRQSPAFNPANSSIG